MPYKAQWYQKAPGLIKHATVWELWVKGGVCTGPAKAPGSPKIDQIKRWKQAHKTHESYGSRTRPIRHGHRTRLIFVQGPIQFRLNAPSRSVHWDRQPSFIGDLSPGAIKFTRKPSSECPLLNGSEEEKNDWNIDHTMGAQRPKNEDPVEGYCRVENIHGGVKPEWGSKRADVSHPSTDIEHMCIHA